MTFDKKRYDKLWQKRRELLSQLTYLHFDVMSITDMDSQIDMEFGTDLYQPSDFESGSTSIPMGSKTIWNKKMNKIGDSVGTKYKAIFTLSDLGAFMAENPVYPKNMYTDSEWREVASDLDESRFNLAKNVIQKEKTETRRGALRAYQLYQNDTKDFEYSQVSRLMDDSFKWRKGEHQGESWDWHETKKGGTKTKTVTHKVPIDAYLDASSVVKSADEANLLRNCYIAACIGQGYGHGSGDVSIGVWHLGMFFPNKNQAHYFIDAPDGISGHLIVNPALNENDDHYLSHTPVLYHIGHQEFSNAHFMTYPDPYFENMYTNGVLDPRIPLNVRLQVVKSYLNIAKEVKIPVKTIAENSIAEGPMHLMNGQAIDENEIFKKYEIIKNSTKCPTTTKTVTETVTETVLPEGWYTYNPTVNHEQHFEHDHEFVNKNVPKIFGVQFPSRLSYDPLDGAYRYKLRYEDENESLDCTPEDIDPKDIGDDDAKRARIKKRTHKLKPVVEELRAINQELKDLGESAFPSNVNNLEGVLKSIAGDTPDLSQIFKLPVLGSNPSFENRTYAEIKNGSKFKLRTPDENEGLLEDMKRGDWPELAASAYIVYHSLKGLPEKYYHDPFKFLASMPGNEKTAKSIIRRLNLGADYFDVIEKSPFGYIGHANPRGYIEKALGKNWTPSSNWALNPYEDKAPARDWSMFSAFDGLPAIEPSASLEEGLDSPHYDTLNSPVIKGSGRVIDPEKRLELGQKSISELEL